MRWYHLLLSTCFPAFWVAACSNSDDIAALCDAGSNVFCRCRGGGAGTKQCNATGDGFGSCETDSGACEEVQDDPNNPTGAGGSGPEPSEPGTLLGHCDESVVCEQGLTCSMGYCTKPCLSYMDCGDNGDCVMWESGAICMPYCVTQSDCMDFSMASACGYTDQAVPAFQTLVCADWGDMLQLPPDGFPPNQECNNDNFCNLGFEHRERVCSLSGCTDGCHADTDCTDMAAMCSSTAPDDLGVCSGGMSTEDGDDCPGIPLTLSLANPDKSVQGDTGQAVPPSEHACDSPCVASMSPPSEEMVYALTITGAPSCSFSTPCTVTALLETSDSSYDPQLYAREQTCEGNLQLTYSDEIGGGVSEIMEWSVFNNETHWIFVDGWQGSTGAFTLSLNLAQP